MAAARRRGRRLRGLKLKEAKRPFGLHAFLAGSLLVAGTLAAYRPALDAGFVWHDNEHVSENPLLLSAAGLWRIWTDPSATPQYYPLTFTSFWIEYRLWGLQPRGYHAVNVLLHGLNAVLLWRLLRRLRLPGAWMAAAVFAVHPVAVESVRAGAPGAALRACPCHGLAARLGRGSLHHRRRLGTDAA